MKILKEVRFSDSLLILLEIRFVWNNRAQKHSLSIDVRLPSIWTVFPLLYRIDELAGYIIRRWRENNRNKEEEEDEEEEGKQ